MRYFLLYVLVGVWSMLKAQQDSLLYELNEPGNDTERVNQLYKTGFALRHTDPALAYRYAVAAENAALQSGSGKHLAKSYNLKGILHYKKGDYSQALTYQFHALRLNEQAGSMYGVAINQTNLGNIYSDVGYDDAAEDAYLKALKAYNALNNRQQIVNSLMNLGVLKEKGKHHRLALRYFQAALQMATEDQNMEVMAACHNNIGAVLMEENLPDSALLYLDEGLKLLDLQDNVLEMADVYNNMAMSYTKKGMPGEAKACLQKADSIAQVYDYTDARLHLYESHALLCEYQQDFRQANAWLRKHQALKDSLSQSSREAMVLSFSDETPEAVAYQHTENIAETTFKNGWLLVILGALIVGIPLFLIRYKR